MKRARRRRPRARHARDPVPEGFFAMLWAWMRSCVGPALMPAAFGAAVVGGVMGVEYLKARGGTTEQAVVTRVTPHVDGLFTGCKGAPKYTLNLRSEHPPAGLPTTFTSSGCDQGSYAVGDVVPVRRVHGRVVLDPPDLETVGGGVLLGALAGPVFVALGLLLCWLVALPFRALRAGWDRARRR